MKLISKFHDYYDTAIGYGIDPNIIYIRKTREYKEDSDIYKEIEKKISLKTNFNFRNTFSYKNVTIENTHYIFFCGKIYPCIEISIKDEKKYPIDGFITKYCFNVNYIEKILKPYKITIPKRAPRKYLKYGWNYDRRRFVKEKLRESFKSIATEKNIIDLHFLLDSPVFILHKYADNEGMKLVVNPQLKKYDFYRMVDSFTAFQELSMFIGGVMGGKSPKMVEISNKDKIAKHGFDEYSFRKEKEK